MSEDIVNQLAIALVLGLAAQWLSWLFRLPAILLLLTFGIVAGPWLGILDPDQMMGKLLVPIVSISVALILFEGGMSLKKHELYQVGGVVRRLITTGALLTWLIITLFAWLLLGVEPGLAFLIGAILTVTGPTVIGPILHQVRPRGGVGPILKWESIYIDPIGALLAVLVFEALLAGNLQHAGTIMITGILQTIVVGVIVGGIGAAIIVILLKRNWIPEFLDNPITLIIVIAAFSLSNHFQAESGLFTVTLMGTLLANQSFVSVRHISRFKEDLRVLLISFLFIILAARLRIEDLSILSFQSTLFLLLLIVIVRPLTGWLSTIGSSLTWNERLYICMIAPRGIIAAAVSSVFALKLSQIGYPNADKLVPITFMVIIGTVFFYGILAYPFARLLKLAQPDPQGLLILGAQSWARSLAAILISEKIPVLMVDTNRKNILAARLNGIPACRGNIMEPEIRKDLDLGGIGQMVALTSHNGTNSLAAIECAELFERDKIYQLPSKIDNKTTSSNTGSKHRARTLFDKELNYSTIYSLISSGYTVRKTRISKEFSFDHYQALFKGQAHPLMFITEGKDVIIVSTDMPLIPPKSGTTIISLAPPKEVAYPG